MPNRQQLQEMLDLTCVMWDDPNVRFYQDLELTDTSQRSVFLAGPSSRQDVLEFKWRPLGVHYLRKAGFQGIIYVPEPREDDWSFKESFPIPIVKWESIRILTCNIVMVWFRRHQIQLPGRVTATELAFLSGMIYADPEKFKDRLVFGHPPDAWKVKSDVHWASLAGITPYHNLQPMCEHVAKKLALK